MLFKGDTDRPFNGDIIGDVIRDKRETKIYVSLFVKHALSTIEMTLGT
jgi:hypothetical protein